MCCAEFIAKYLLFIVNLIVSLVGLAVLGLGITSLIYVKDVNEILPVNVIPISMIVLGSVVFLIAFLACCGAMRESPCMLVSYAILVGLLAALKIWLVVVVYSSMRTVQDTVDGWLVSAFSDNDLRPAFQLLEHSFSCCGTTGAGSYTAISETIPFTCCNDNWSESANVNDLTVCTAGNSFQGCGLVVSDWFESFGGAIGAVLLVVITVEVTAIIFACFFCHSVRQKRSKTF